MPWWLPWLALLCATILILWGLLYWASRYQTIIRRWKLPGGGPPLRVETDHAARFPESRFDN